jgi:hypothetical protein
MCIAHNAEVEVFVESSANVHPIFDPRLEITHGSKESDSFDSFMSVIHLAGRIPVQVAKLSLKFNSD